MKIYTVIAGVNGVGKSSLTGVLKAQSNDLGFVIDVDKLSAGGKTSAFKAGMTAINKIDECLRKKASFTQETTLSGYKTEKTLRAAKENDYYVRMYYVGLSSQNESLARIENRVRKGGHNVLPDDVNRRYLKRFADLKRVLPYCDEVFLFDNENGFSEVGEYKNGELIIKGDYRPDWLCELAAALKE